MTQSNTGVQVDDALIKLVIPRVIGLKHGMPASNSKSLRETSFKTSHSKQKTLVVVSPDAMDPVQLDIAVYGYYYSLFLFDEVIFINKDGVDMPMFDIQKYPAFICLDGGAEENPIYYSEGSQYGFHS